MPVKQRTTRRKKSRQQDRHTTPRLVFHLPHDLLAALEAYRRSNRLQPSISFMLRHALEEYLAARGCWPPDDGGAE